ncbi:sensor histidine kinase, partial [Clostridioides difficile]|nr:sensor histidine kinase [Clostridioides difficile]
MLKNMNLKDGLSVKDDYIMRRVIVYSVLSVLIVTLVFILFEYSRLHKLYEHQI